MSECIEWAGCRGTDGYGIWPSLVTEKGRMQPKAHRMAYCAHHGLKLSDIDGLHVLHRCDNPPCINPNHLFLGTDKDNSDDKIRKGRHAWGERAGHAKLTEEQVREIRETYKPRDKQFGARALGRKFGICHQNISDIAGKRRWRDLK